MPPFYCGVVHYGQLKLSSNQFVEFSPYFATITFPFSTSLYIILMTFLQKNIRTQIAPNNPQKMKFYVCTKYKYFFCIGKDA